MVERIIDIIVRIAIFVSAAVYIYGASTGWMAISPIFAPLALLIMILGSRFLFREERQKYQLFISKNPEAEKKDRRSRRIMYMGMGFFLVSLVFLALSIVIIESSENGLVWAFRASVAVSTLSLVFACASIIFRIVSWTVRYFTRVYKH